MKLLLVTILLCLFGSALSNQCFYNGIYGYGTSYNTVGFQVNTVQNNNVVPLSYSDSGMMVVNYLAKTMYNSINYDTNSGTTYMEVFTFGVNQTQYTVIGSKCYKQRSAPFPTSLPLVPLYNANNFTVGDTSVEQWQIIDAYTDYLTFKTLNVNAKTCAFMISTAKNVNSNGNSVTVFSNFKQTLYDIRLPYLCYNAQQQPNDEFLNNSRLGLLY